MLLALPWLASLISSNSLHISLVVFATRLPWLLFSIPVGVLTDRFDRRTLMICADVVRLVLGLTVTAVLLYGSAQTGLIFVLTLFAFLTGIAEVFRDNAAQSFLPNIVESGDLEQANGQLWTVEQIAGSLIGPPLAGLLIAIGLPVPFAVAALGYGGSVLMLMRLTSAARMTELARDSMVEEMIVGINWMRSHQLIFALAIMLGVLNAVSTMSLTVLVLFSQEILGLSAVGYGLLLTSTALGGVVGGLICPLLAARLGPRWALLIALSVWPLAFVGIGMASSAWQVALILFVEMFAAVLWNVVTVSYRQRAIPDGLLGRVNSIYRCFGWGMMPVGALAAGAVVAVAESVVGREIALRLPYFIAAGCCLGLLVYAVRALHFEAMPSSGKYR